MTGFKFLCFYIDINGYLNVHCEAIYIDVVDECIYMRI